MRCEVLMMCIEKLRIVRSLLSTVFAKNILGNNAIPNSNLLCSCYIGGLNSQLQAPEVYFHCLIPCLLNVTLNRSVNRLSGAGFLTEHFPFSFSDFSSLYDVR